MTNEPLRTRYCLQPGREWRYPAPEELPTIDLPMAAVVLDDPSDIPDDVDEPRALVGLDVLAMLLERDKLDWLATRTWLPMLPFEMSTDLAAASDLLASRELGSPRLVDVTVTVGRSTGIEWDPDAPAAVSRVEGIVFATRIAERLTGGKSYHTRTLVDGDPLVLTSQINDATTIMRIVSADTAPIAGFQADVLATAGRVTLRHEFAPGALGIWRTGSPGYLFPALSTEKHNIQAPDSARGGWETTRLLSALVATPPPEPTLGEHAVRLTAQAIQLLKARNS